jgi:hypothetical protein|tara:strand:+ start:462 stop:1118 length:657 start_codon:yes stop_codon:yes gene_type:complete
MLVDSNDIEWLDSGVAFGPKYKKVIPQLNWINKYLGNDYQTIQAFKKISAKSNVEKEITVRVLDLVYYSGYVLKKVRDLLNRSGYFPYLIGINNNKKALRLVNITLSQYDNKVLLENANERFHIPEVDFLISSHFLNLNKNKVSHSILFSELNMSNSVQFFFGLFNRFSGFEPEVLKVGLKALKRASRNQELQSTFSEFKNLQIRKSWFNRTLIYGKL